MKLRKHNIVWLVFFLLILPAVVQGSSGVGFGIIVGEPTGLSFKAWVSRTTAFAAAAAWSFKDERKLHFHLDYLLHNFKVFRLKSGKLPLYYGIGGRIKFETDTRLGIRIPIGVCYIFKHPSLDIFFEIVPLLDLAPETAFNLNASIGLRYFF